MKHQFINQSLTQSLSRSQRSQIVHSAFCNLCNNVITGYRYKCTVCKDFDLCENCEETQYHSEDHPFLKIRRPGNSPYSAPSINNFVPPNMNYLQTFSSFNDSKNDGFPQQTFEQSKFSATFLYHVNFPDGAKVYVGDKFQKTWKLKNTGSVNWENVFLVHIGGDIISIQEANRVPTVAVGEEIEISIDCFVQKSGKMVSNFRLQAPDLTKFGPQIYMNLNAGDQVEKQLDFEKTRTKIAKSTSTITN